MSRIGNQPIELPEGIQINVEDNVVTVSNGNASLTQKIDPSISVKIEDNTIIVGRDNDSKESKSLHGLYRSLISNMVTGLKEGFQKKLEVNGIGFRVSMQGNKLVMNIGYSHPVEIEAPEGITIETPTQTEILVKGADKQLVGEVAAKIRASRVPDVYHAKGIKYDYEVLRRKEGKTGAGA